MLLFLAKLFNLLGMTDTFLKSTQKWLSVPLNFFLILNILKNWPWQWEEGINWADCKVMISAPKNLHLEVLVSFYLFCNFFQGPPLFLGPFKFLRVWEKENTLLKYFEDILEWVTFGHFWSFYSILGLFR